MSESRYFTNAGFGDDDDAGEPFVVGYHQIDRNSLPIIIYLEVVNRQKRAERMEAETLWLTYAVCFLTSSVVGGFAWRRLSIYLLDLFPPVHRSWPAASVVVAISVAALAGGIFLVRLRHGFVGSIVAGLDVGVCLSTAFLVWVLRILPSC